MLADVVQIADPLTLIVSVLVGFTVVLGGLLAHLASDRQREDDVHEPGPELPQGVVEVLTTLRSAAIVLDVADDVIRATPAAYANGLVRGRTVPHTELLELVRAVRREGSILERELELPRGPLGSGTIVVDVRVAPLGSLHVLVLAEDRTESRRIEEVRRDFAANVSHELKTPVGAISLLAETMAEAADDPDAIRRFAARTQQEAVRLSALVQEIIDLSRVQSAPELDRPELVDIDGVITEAVDRAHLAAQAKSIQITVGGDHGATVYGDRGLLVTAMKNLVDNAVRYSEDNTRIGIGVRITPALVEIAVADQGIGIAPADQSRVFERFYRVDPARSRATGGTGLGLSIVKHVAANHGGEVTVWSQVDQGSTFTLRLPLAHPLDESAAETQPAGSLPAQTSQRRSAST